MTYLYLCLYLYNCTSRNPHSKPAVRKLALSCPFPISRVSSFALGTNGTTVFGVVEWLSQGPESSSPGGSSWPTQPLTTLSPSALNADHRDVFLYFEGHALSLQPFAVPSAWGLPRAAPSPAALSGEVRTTPPILYLGGALP